MTRAVILVSRGFQDQEFCYMFDRALEEGWAVDIATPSVWRKDGEEHSGKPDQIFGSFGVPAKITKTTDDLRVEDYDLVMIPGGFISPDILRMRPEVLTFVRNMFDSGKLVAAICHAPWVLISAGIVKGIRATCYASLKDDLINAGAIYVDNIPVVTHMNIITSDHYKNNGPFMRAVVNYINARA